MIALATISSIVDKYHVTVNCPDLNLIGVTAIICTVPGIEQEYRIGNVVVIGVEDNDTSHLVVFGVVYNKSNKNQNNVSIAASSLNVNCSFNSYNNIKIGNASETEFGCIENLNTNLYEYFEDDYYDKFDNDLKTFIETSDSQLESLNSIESDIKSLDEIFEKLADKIGELNSKSNKDACGLLNNNDKLTLDNIKRIGEIDGNLKGITDNLASEISSIGISANPEAIFDLDLSDELDSVALSTTPGVTELNVHAGNAMLDRAEKMVNVLWTAKYSFHLWNNSDVMYKAGQQYKGIPYTLFWDAMYYNNWLPHASDNKDDTRDVSGYGKRTGPIYGSCCASFVSDILNIKPKTATCNVLVNHKNLKRLSGDEAKIGNLKMGDVLIRPNKTHCVWIGPVTSTEITIYEQTNSTISGKPAGARKYTVKKSNVTDSSGCYSGYNAYRPVGL